MTWFRRAVFAAALLALAPACGSSGDDGGSVNQGMEVQDETSKLVTAAEGGKVELAKAGITLDIPAGALAEDTTITAETVSRSGLPKSDELAGNAVEFGPDELQFLQPVALTIDLSGAKIPDDADVSIAWLDEDKNEWVDLPGSKLEGGKVTAQTDHFTTFAIRFVVTASGEVVQEGGQCGDDFTACGGDVEGTWNVTKGCADIGDLGNAGMMCAGASLSFGVNITGDITFSGGKLTGQLTFETSQEIIIPKSCAGGMCPEADPSDPDDVVYEDKGDTCEASETDSEVNDVASSYTLEGNTITITDDGETAEEADTAEYCVEGNTLRVRQVTSEGFAVEWTATRK